MFVFPFADCATLGQSVLLKLRFRLRRDGDVPPRTQNTRCGNGDITSQTITKKQKKKLNLTEVKWL